MAHRLQHIGITVSDIDAAIAFYLAVSAGELDGPYVKSGPAVEAVTGYVGIQVIQAFVSFPGGDTVIELLEYRNGSGARTDPDNGKSGAAHPAIVVDDMDAVVERAAALGIHATSEAKVATAGPLEGYRYLYLIGPDDVRVELLEAPHAT